MSAYTADLLPRLDRLIAGGGEERIPERLLAKFWKERAARQKGLRTEAGKRVRVVYPGRSGVTAGPDFWDALLDVEGVRLVRGDVEPHINQADWNAHDHGGNPNYNGVVVQSSTSRVSRNTFAKRVPGTCRGPERSIGRDCRQRARIRPMAGAGQERFFQAGYAGRG